MLLKPEDIEDFLKKRVNVLKSLEGLETKISSEIEEITLDNIEKLEQELKTNYLFMLKLSEQTDSYTYVTYTGTDVLAKLYKPSDFEGIIKAITTIPQDTFHTIKTKDDFIFGHTAFLTPLLATVKDTDSSLLLKGITYLGVTPDAGQVIKTDYSTMIPIPEDIAPYRLSLPTAYYVSQKGFDPVYDYVSRNPDKFNMVTIVDNENYIMIGTNKKQDRINSFWMELNINDEKEKTILNAGNIIKRNLMKKDN